MIIGLMRYRIRENDLIDPTLALPFTGEGTIHIFHNND